MLGRSAEEVALFLTKTEGLNKTLCGDYLGEREDFNLKVGIATHRCHAHAWSSQCHNFKWLTGSTV